MAERKTKATRAGADAYIAAIVDEPRRRDCATLMALLGKATGAPPVMWGTAIVGFGVHTYPLAGGKVGEICAVGFSSRKADIAIYGVMGSPAAATRLPALGKYRSGKGCLYVGRLADIDLAVLATLVRQAFKDKQA